MPVAASVSRGLMLMHRAVVEGLLCVAPARRCAHEVERLRGSRSAAVELEASELRRIERDLHDGAQQRLVMLSIDLGLAADRIDTDPAVGPRARRRGPDQARLALAELRDLVRGIAPAILLDRGLVAALSAIAGRCPVPTVVESTLPAGERLPDAMERAAYFVVAEALANVAKHASADALRDPLPARRRARLVVEVWDDGAGGARILPGGGLAGLAGRVEALDGREVQPVARPVGRGAAARGGGPTAGPARRERPRGCGEAYAPQGRPAPPARGGGRSPSRAAPACRRCC